MRLAVTMLIVFFIAVFGTLLLVVCVPEGQARKREVWQLGVCLDTEHGTQCGPHERPFDREDDCRKAEQDLQLKIVVGRARCAKVMVDDV